MSSIFEARLSVRKVTRLYEPAASRDPVLKPLWHVGEGRMLFAGCLQRNALHSHAAPVLIAGLYENFRFRIKGSDWLSCRAAVVRAGMAYEFDAGGHPMAVLYVEPNAASAEGLAALVDRAREERGALIAMGCDIAPIRALYEDAASADWASEATADLVKFSNARARRSVDERVRKALDTIVMDEDCETVGGHLPAPPVTLAARSVKLSTSRFQHLFKQEVGVSYRRYAAWVRMRAAVSEVVGGGNLTTAAHAAGFYDQPHFAREFRRIFGAPASRSLANVR
jgi:AraC-like DNA-binding protein